MPPPSGALHVHPKTTTAPAGAQSRLLRDQASWRSDHQPVEECVLRLRGGGWTRWTTVQVWRGEWGHATGRGEEPGAPLHPSCLLPLTLQAFQQPRASSKMGGGAPGRGASGKRGSPGRPRAPAQLRFAPLPRPQPAFRPPPRRRRLHPQTRRYFRVGSWVGSALAGPKLRRAAGNLRVAGPR